VLKASGTSNQTSCLIMRTRLALAEADDSQALSLSEQALASARSERSGDAVRDNYRVADAYRRVGDIQLKLGDPVAARNAWSSGLAIIPTNAAENPLETDEHALILERLGRTGEAARLLSRLSAIGYRRQT
jgi:predicted negative regulator of RcsB-dependent stress response